MKINFKPIEHEISLSTFVITIEILSIKYLMIDLTENEHLIIILSILHNRKTITD